MGLIADAAQVDGTGKLSVLGEFNTIKTPGYPFVHNSMSVVARWTADKGEVPSKKSKLQIALVDQDGTSVLGQSPELQMNWEELGDVEPGKLRAQVILNMTSLRLLTGGTYAFHFTVDGKKLGVVRFLVAKV